jgi:hypothetical protein
MNSEKNWRNYTHGPLTGLILVVFVRVKLGVIRWQQHVRDTQMIRLRARRVGSKQ